jgi:muconate cycloisomerase
MRIASVELHRLRIPFKQAFAHAAGSRSENELVLVALRDEVGTVGWGEIVPRPYVTGESMGDVLAEHAPALARALAGRAFAAGQDAIEWIVRAAERNVATATLGGFDLALLDLAGKRFGFSLAAALGGIRHDALPAGVVIGFEVATAQLPRHCAMLRFSGRRHVKVKVGLDDDRERLQTIAHALPGIRLRLDANMAWTADLAITRLRALADLPVDSIEQPVAKQDLEGLRAIREATGMRVMADESVCTLDDLERAISARAIDLVHVRVGKMGGALATARLCDRARTAGIGLQLGTMVGETGVLSRAAELLGRCVDGFECLDGRGQNAFLLQSDVLADSGTAGAPGDDAPGLGVDVSIERVRGLAVAAPAVYTP